jgi:catechol 2,3-dioxygenase-like lactoylglutathione lyase family enzyme
LQACRCFVSFERNSPIHTQPKITGLNHLTLAVCDLDRSITFYRDILGCCLRARWPEGAYLEAGDLWLCLSVNSLPQDNRRSDYTHFAFSVEQSDFTALSSRISETCTIWKDNKSEGASIYFLDPDGHKLEIHLGKLETRLAHYRAAKKGIVEVFDLV